MKSEEIRDLNEPAFPIAGACANHQFCGMTLRDYFAARVEIDAEISVQTAEAVVNRKMPIYKDEPISNMRFWAEFNAILRYMQADAMLAERAK